MIQRCPTDSVWCVLVYIWVGVAIWSSVTIAVQASHMFETGLFLALIDAGIMCMKGLVYKICSPELIHVCSNIVELI